MTTLDEQDSYSDERPDIITSTMAQAIKVDSPFATPHDTARILGVSKSRANKIIRRVKGMLHRDSATGELTVNAKRTATGTYTRKNDRHDALPKAKKTKKK